MNEHSQRERPQVGAFDLSRLVIKPLEERRHDLARESFLALDELPPPLAEPAMRDLAVLGRRLVEARNRGAARLLLMGAHVIRAGVARQLIDMLQRGLITHVGMNGAGPIHDYELARIGATCESVARYIRTGEFGLWRETGELNDVVRRGAAAGWGFGESVGRAILDGEFPYRDTSITAACVRLGVPITVHVGIGYDILHEHPNFDAAACGLASYRDFLKVCATVERLEGGVFLCFGSAVMGPEVYLKALSMARNVARQEGREIAHFTTAAFDLIPVEGDFRSEAPRNNPQYYYRPWKTILVRTVSDGGESFYVCGDHRQTLPHLRRAALAAEKELSGEATEADQPVIIAPAARAPDRAARVARKSASSISLDRLETILAQLPHLRVALVGDLFLDRYLEIDPARAEPSVETGLTAHQVVRVRNAPGALGTVMNNLAALGMGTLLPVSVIGDDGHGYDLVRELSRLPVDDRHLLRDPARLTPTYTKPIQSDVGGAWRELNRLDVRTRAVLSDDSFAALARNLREALASCDGLIVLDQLAEEQGGIVDARVRELLEAFSKQQLDRLIFVDSRSQLDRFRCGTLKGNATEVLSASGMSDSPHSRDPVTIAHAAQLLNRRTGRSVYCTLGSEGMLVVQSSQDPMHIAGLPATGPVDIVGAGDSATAGIVSSLLAGATAEEAAAVGNLVASITVEQLGTTGTATPEQMIARRRQWSD
jgi:rfaE bifunctional protein kinase chain/domain